MARISSTGEHVVLVSESGENIGTCEKLQAHIDGKLHRAFSLMIIRKTAAGYEFLLQQRAENKYHSGAKWSNTCCSHPRPNESLNDAVQRRVGEELGITQALNLSEISSFHYCEALGNGLIENEYDHVFVSFDNIEHMLPNPEEVSHVAWVNETELANELKENPSRFTVWLEAVCQRVESYLEENNLALEQIAS